jgi:hypothetical protein
MDDCTKAIYNDEIYFKFDEVVMVIFTPSTNFIKII